MAEPCEITNTCNKMVEKENGPPVAMSNMLL